MFITCEDANIIAQNSINSIKEYQHKIYRLSISKDKNDLLYAKCVDELVVAKIIEFFNYFNYKAFNKLTEIEKESIFSELMNLYKNLIFDSDNLRRKYIKEHFRE